MLSPATVLGVKINNQSEEELSDDYKGKMKVVFGDDPENAIITVSFLDLVQSLVQITEWFVFWILSKITLFYDFRYLCFVIWTWDCTWSHRGRCKSYVIWHKHLTIHFS